MDVENLRPLCHLLVIDDDLRLREEAGKTVRKTELFGALSSVICAAGTPAVEKRAVCMQLSHVLNHGRNGNTLAASAANERVVNVYVDAELARHA
jgi:hypothetical protein